MYAPIFPEPKALIGDVGSLVGTDGQAKMSKSVGGSYIALTDDLQMISAKLAKAPTDAGGPGEVPITGPVANLFKFLELFLPNRLEYYGEAYRQGKLRYAELKEELARAIYGEIRPIQERREQFKSKSEMVDEIIHEGARKAKEAAGKTLQEVKEKMGLLV